MWLRETVVMQQRERDVYGHRWRERPVWTLTERERGLYLHQTAAIHPSTPRRRASPCAVLVSASLQRKGERARLGAYRLLTPNRLQGYLAHNKIHPPRTTIRPRCQPTVHVGS